VIPISKPVKNNSSVTLVYVDLRATSHMSQEL
jgi:hypothetical protein